MVGQWTGNLFSIFGGDRTGEFSDTMTLVALALVSIMPGVSEKQQTGAEGQCGA